MKRQFILGLLLLLALGMAFGSDNRQLANAQSGSYDLTWNTIDGGGVMNATGGVYTLVGTIGQPDAGATMTGGGFTLAGGFWGGGASQYQVYLPVVLK